MPDDKGATSFLLSEVTTVFNIFGVTFKSSI